MMSAQALTPFPCNACGQCCRRVNLSCQTAFLDRGDGICCYFDEQTDLCTIYETRPLVCRVEEYYKTHLSGQIAWTQFVKINAEICQKFQEETLEQ